jgi:predicted nucleic acid-binding protein
VGRVRFIIDDEPLRRLRQAAGAKLAWLRRRVVKARLRLKTLGLGMPHASVTVVHVEQPAPGTLAGSRRSEKVSFGDAVACSIMQRYGIEEVFSREKVGDLRRSPP